MIRIGNYALDEGKPKPNCINVSRMIWSLKESTTEGYAQETIKRQIKEVLDYFEKYARGPRYPI